MLSLYHSKQILNKWKANSNKYIFIRVNNASKNIKVYICWQYALIVQIDTLFNLKYKINYKNT